MTMKNLERCSWSMLACLAVSVAHAEGHNHSATLSMLGDENDNRQWLGKVALPLGDHMWVQGSVGRSELATAARGNTKIVGAAMGVGLQSFDAAVDFMQRRAETGFEQQDWAATLDWHGDRGGMGADLFLRSAAGESKTTTRSGSVFAPPVTTTIKESLEATGFGLHGAFALTPRTSVFAGAMRYRYDFSVESMAPGTSTPLSSLLGTTDALSGAWRDQAYIDRSYRVGLRHRFQAASLAAQYLHDRAANTGAVVSTVQLQAELLLAERWLISPSVGYSFGDSNNSTGFGGLSLSLVW
jgi:hypothetical protein